MQENPSKNEPKPPSSLLLLFTMFLLKKTTITELPKYKPPNCQSGSLWEVVSEVGSEVFQNHVRRFFFHPVSPGEKKR